MYKKKLNQIIILIPSYNDLINLKKFILNIKKKFKILVIDDASSDDTSKFLKNNKISFIQNDFNIGYERSLIKGFKEIIKNSKAKYIITMDADGQHRIQELNSMISVFKKNKADLLIGARHKKNRITEIILSYIFKQKFNIADPVSGFKMYRIQKLKKIILNNKQNLFLVDLVMSFYKSNFKVICKTIRTKKRPNKPKVGNNILVNLKILKILLFSLVS